MIHNPQNEGRFIFFYCLSNVLNLTCTTNVIVISIFFTPLVFYFSASLQSSLGFIVSLKAFRKFKPKKAQIAQRMHDYTENNVI